jgi:predicted transcriptional regulator
MFRSLAGEAFMAALHLQKVPEELVQRIERLAERVRQTPEEVIVRLLEEAVPCERAEQRQRVREILDQIRQNPIVPAPGTTDSVELLREDRNR